MLADYFVGLSPEAAAALAAKVLQHIAQQGQHIEAQAKAIEFKEARIQSILFELRRLKAEISQLKAEAGVGNPRFIGNTPQMREMFSTLETIGNMRRTVPCAEAR